jgi:hypothetical protein
MAVEPLTAFERLEELPEPISECGGGGDAGASPGGPWRAGFLATDTVVYTSGRIAREVDPVRHHVDPDELARCRSLTDEVASIGGGYLDSEGAFDWHPFFVAANSDEPVPERIDERLVRERFGGTILPIAPIVIQPLVEESPWWDMMIRSIHMGSDNLAKLVRKVPLDLWMERSFAGARALAEGGLYDYETDKEQQKVGDKLLRKILAIGDDESLTWTDVSTTLQIFRLIRLVRFFGGPDFLDAAYVEIGDYHDFQRIPRDQWPPGLQGWPCCMPRLLIGLTRGGSLAGLIGYIVQT